MALLQRSSPSRNGHRPGDAPLRHRATVTAAAKRVRSTPGLDAKAQLAGLPTPQKWHPLAWECFDAVPEVKHAVWFTGNAMAKLTLFAAVRPSPDEPPIPVDDPRSGISQDVAASAMAEVARLHSARGGLAELLRSLNMNLEVTGLAWLIGRGARDAGVDPKTGKPTPATPESWEIRSSSQVQLRVEQTNDGEQVVADVRDAPGATPYRLDGERDTFTPIWQPHPQWSSVPDCHLRAAITDCRALQYLTGQVLAEAMSSIPAEILKVPNELSFEDPRSPVDAEDEGDPDEVDPADDSEEGPDPLDEALDEHLSGAIEDPTSPYAFRHLVVRGPAEYLKSDVFGTLPLRRTTADVDVEARIEARVKRLARGINLPVEVVMGHQATTFANAEQVDEDTFEDYLEPRCELIADALTVAYLRPNMLDAYGTNDAGDEVPVDGEVGGQIAQVIVWYDADRLRASADTNAGADAALEKFAISLAAYRKAKGFNEDDAPDVTETLVMAGLRRGILTAELTRALLELLGKPLQVEALPTAPPEEQAEARNRARMSRLLEGLEVMEAYAATGALPAAARVTSSRPVVRDNPGHVLATIDADLRTRLVAAADQAVGRALTTAGNRLASMPGPHRGAVRNVSPHLRMASLGRSLVDELTADGNDLLAGAFDELERQFRTWGAAAQGRALDTVGRVVGGFTTAERDALGLRQAGDLDEAWGWFDGQLRALAEARMFVPDPTAPDLGEFDATARVPTGMVRQAVSRAGGAAQVTTDGTSAFVSLVDNGTRPAGGIGTGELLRGTMRDHGVLVEAYVWVYGPAFRSRPFEPHVDLDGIVFDNFDDPILANHDGWPPFEFYMPGDHPGCVCDFEPVLVTPDELDE